MVQQEKTVQITYVGDKGDGETAAEVKTTLLSTIEVADEQGRAVVRRLLQAGNWTQVQANLEQQFCPACAITDRAVTAASKSNFVDLANCRTATLTTVVPAPTIEAAIHGVANEEAFKRALDSLFKQEIVACFYAVGTIISSCTHPIAVAGANTGATAGGRMGIRPVATVNKADARLSEYGEGCVEIRVAFPKDFSVDDEIRLAATIAANRAQMSSASSAEARSGTTTLGNVGTALAKLSWSSDAVSFTL